MNEVKLSTPLAVRVPCTLREWLKIQARQSQRSLNKEIVYRLEQSRAHDEARGARQ